MSQAHQSNQAIELLAKLDVEPIYDRIVKEAERERITSISRSQAFQLERKGQFPKRVRLSSHSVGWRLSSLLDWVSSREAA
jgi:predicted DNA-binding transcriptional regulator AlpA